MQGLIQKDCVGLIAEVSSNSGDSLVRNFTITSEKTLVVPNILCPLIDLVSGYIQVDSCVVRLAVEAASIYGIAATTKAHIMVIDSQVHVDSRGTWYGDFGRFGKTVSKGGSAELTNVVFGFVGLVLDRCFPDDSQLMLDGELTNECL